MALLNLATADPVAIQLNQLKNLNYGNKCINNMTFHHSTDCSKFLVCSSGIWMEKDCPAGLHFSGVLGNCEWPATANCVLGGGVPVENTPPNLMVCDENLLGGTFN